jgi:hypothetical protein
MFVQIQNRPFRHIFLLCVWAWAAHLNEELFAQTRMMNRICFQLGEVFVIGAHEHPIQEESAVKH